MRLLRRYGALLAGPLLLAAVVFLALPPSPADGQQKLDDESLIRRCIELAKSSVAKGNQPFGALMVRNGKVIMMAENTVETDDNTCHHAEINLIAAVFRKYGPKGLKGSTLYTSCEPCPMCCGAIYMSGVSRVVYGMSTKRLSAMSGFKDTIYARKFFALPKRKIEVTGPVLEAEAAAVMAQYLKTWEKPQ